MRVSVVCVAVIGKLNEPLYIRTFGQVSDDIKDNALGEGGLHLHFHVHAALDVIEEKLAFSKKNKKVYPSARALSLGLLFTIEDYKVYGYLTNTNMKLVVVTHRSHTNEDIIKQLFRQLHDVYVQLLANPFYKLNSIIESGSFHERVCVLVSRYSR